MQYGWQVQSSITVVRLDAKTNQPGTIVTVAKPCAGLVVGFGSLWIPSCGDHTVVRVDAETGTVFRVRVEGLKIWNKILLHG